MIYDELPSSWRFVDDQKKLTKHKSCEDCSQMEPAVYTSLDVLPSFIFRTTGVFFMPISFDLHELTSGNVVGMASEIPNMKVFVIGDYTYIALNKTTYTVSPLQTGLYQAEISDGAHTIYSEPIRICDSVNKCIQFDWTNSCDLAGIPYAYLETAFGSPFLNTYSVVNANLISPAYETQKENLENMMRQTDVFYLNQVRTFSVKHIEVPEWFVRSVQVMQLHDTITVSYDFDNNHQNGLYTTDVEECTVTSSPDENGCGNSLEVKIRQDDAVITTTCCVNAEPEPCLEACYDVAGFRPDASPPVEGSYYIHDFDSGTIDRYIGGEWTTITEDCVYVFNEDTDTNMYYNGDVWQSTPDITSVDVVIIQGNLTTIALTGFSMPGTFVYVGSSSLEGGCNFEPIAYSAEDLASGNIQIVVDTDTYYYVCIKSVNHTCEYDTRQIHFEL